MKLGNDALKKVVDAAITEAKADGTYDAIYTKWIGASSAEVTVALSGRRRPGSRLIRERKGTPMALDTAAPPEKPRMARRVANAARLTRWVQYVVGILVVLFIAFTADWAQFSDGVLPPGRRPADVPEVDHRSG